MLKNYGKKNRCKKENFDKMNNLSESYKLIELEE